MRQQQGAHDERQRGDAGQRKPREENAEHERRDAGQKLPSEAVLVPRRNRMQEIFRFRRVGRGSDGRVLGQYEAAGVRPRFMEALAARGISLPTDLFAVGRVSA